MPAATKKKAKPARRTAKRRPLSAREKMRAYRARMRARGFKLVQVWVPDVNRPGFAEEIRRQSLLVSGTRGEREAIEFLNALAEDSDEWT